MSSGEDEKNCKVFAAAAKPPLLSNASAISSWGVATRKGSNSTLLQVQSMLSTNRPVVKRRGSNWLQKPPA